MSRHQWDSPAGEQALEVDHARRVQRAEVQRLQDEFAMAVRRRRLRAEGLSTTGWPRT